MGLTAAIRPKHGMRAWTEAKWRGFRAYQGVFEPPGGQQRDLAQQEPADLTFLKGHHRGPGCGFRFDKADHTVMINIRGRGQTGGGAPVLKTMKMLPMFDASERC